MTTAIPSDDTTLRQRKPQTENTITDASKRTAATIKKNDASGFSVLDALRAVAGLLLAGGLAGYMITGSVTWGLQERKPWWLQSAGLKSAVSGPLQLTNAQLSAYDGSTPNTPIYLAINRTIYDVSASPHVYGPGGMYSTLAAKDASRSYITTCFDPAEDLVPYLSGVEEIYVPLWLSKNPGQGELDAIAGKEGEVVGGKSGRELIGEIKKRLGEEKVLRMQEEAYVAARERVKTQIKTWEGMFERKAYPVVGKVVGIDEEKDVKKWKDLGFCEAARKQRPSMAESLAEVMKSFVGGAGAGMGKKENIGLGREEKAMKGAAGGEAGKKGKGREAMKGGVAKEKVKEQKKKEAKEKKKDKKAKPAAHP